ncbi:MAG TPA: GNAT family N-acetyltransferase [Pilimelia sp.]|nr:GNAT family N-acetyltransferase [Pilimelia sp.]
MEPPEITAEGLLLRAWRPADAAAVTAACQDPAISRWTSVPSPYLPRHAAEFVGEVAPAAWARGTGLHLAVVDRDSGLLYGSCGFVHLDRAAGDAEIGYWVAPAARGRGVAERAARALLAWGLDRLGLRRVVWRAEVGNHRSRLVAVRLGFTLGGVDRAAVCRPGRPRADLWTASLLPGELTAPGPDRPGAPGTPVARHAATFARPQPRLATAAADGSPITLRPPCPADRADWVDTWRDPQTRRWLAHDARAPHDLVDDDLREAAAGWARGDGVTMVVADAADRFAGYLRLGQPSARYPREWQCSYAVAPHARGRGYASAALAAAADWAFAALAAERLEWYAFVGNEASRKVAARAGFVAEGVSRFVDGGVRRDCWRAARLAGDTVDMADTGTGAGRRES